MRPIAEHEDELIRGCLKGDRVSQKKLYDKYSRKMFAVCLRYSSSYEQAGDLLQDGFVKLFASLPSFRKEGSFEGWIRRIFVTTALEDVRKRMRNISTTGLEEAENEGYTDQAFNKANADELLKLIQQLPEGYRTVFNLFAIEGYNHKEIAEALGISESTSKTQLFKARAQLQKMLLKLEK